MRKLLFGLFCTVSFVTYPQTEREMVMKAFQEAKILIAQKQYQSAQGRLEDMRVFGVYTDSIDFYMKAIDYHIDLDNVEAKYQKKRFQEARNLYDKIYLKHKDVITSTPTWISRCDTIISAQKQGMAITPELAEKILSLSGIPLQCFENGKTILWISTEDHLIEEMKQLSDKGFKNYYEICHPRVSNVNKYAIIDKKGISQILVLPTSWIGSFSDGMALTHYGITDNSHKTLTYYNMDGKELTINNYEEGKDFHEGLAAVKKKGKWGYVDKSGNEIIPCIYEDAFNFSSGLAIVRTKKLKNRHSARIGESIVFIDRKGNTIIKAIEGLEVRPCYLGSMINNRFSLDGSGKFSEGITHSHSITFDVNGNYLFDNKGIGGYFDRVGDFNCGLAQVGYRCSSLVYDRVENGKTIYRHVYGNEQLWNNIYGFIDKTGKVVIELKYNEVFDFSEGYAWVGTKINGKMKYGCINVKGETVIPFEYEEDKKNNYYLRGGYVFSGGLAGVKKEKWGFVDTKGNVVHPFIYDEILDFSEGLAWVKKDGKWGLIDKFGTSTFDYQLSEH